HDLLSTLRRAAHMSYRFSDSPGGRVRHWEQRRRRGRPSAPWFIRPLIILLAFVLIVVVTWRGIQYALHTRPGSARANAAVYESATPGNHPKTNPATGIIPGWQRDVIVALDEAQRHASEGDATETNIAVDRAASIVIVARLRSQPTPPDFFDDALAKLDQILAAYHTNSRLTAHVTDARVQLAELRSFIEPVPPGTPSSVNIDELLVATAMGATEPPSSAAARSSAPSSGSQPTSASPSSAPASNSKSANNSSSADNSKSATNAAPGQVFVGAPRILVIGAILNPASLGGNLLDATSMPSGAEILEPPMSRLFADNVHAENLTIVGAAQTLDGIHWKNVTFIGTHLRYEGGEVDLHDVRFIHCMFGFPSDDRAGRLATAIARGQTTVVIE
ncbi:MAG TPA: hypothetical protein VKS01_10310, partial [Bryobacteraceae bacterium]|nr:hypothetical protein [Bryobacteraceae bacterium]